MGNDFIRDDLGWIDDFRALPGQCGQPLTQRIYAHALMQQGFSLSRLVKMGFEKEVLYEVSSMMIEDEYERIQS